jgi:hypothetical protein
VRLCDGAAYYKSHKPSLARGNLRHFGMQGVLRLGLPCLSFLTAATPRRDRPHRALPAQLLSAAH